MPDWILAVLLLLLGTGILYLVIRIRTSLDPRQAVIKAATIAFEIWQKSGYAMPRELLNPLVSRTILEEAGLVLKALVVSDLVHRRELSPEAKAPHPELLSVPPVALANLVHQKIQGV